MAIYAATFMGMAPLGALLSGTLAHRIGAPWTVGIGGLLCMTAGGAFAWARPALRPRAHRLIVAQQAEAASPLQGSGGTVVPGEE